MKRILAVILLGIFLVGCNDREDGMDCALQLRQKLMNCKECGFQCTITADYFDKVFTFELQCNFDESGSMEFTVIEPEYISGISGRVESNRGMLTFDDQVLLFPMLADGYISPVCAPWIFMNGLRGGYIHSATQTDEGYYIIFHDSFEQEPLQLEVHTDLSAAPDYAELLWKGRRILTVDVKSFSCV